MDSLILQMCLLLQITFIFDRRGRSIVALIPVKHKRDVQGLTNGIKNFR